jgi:SAM-dependent methyltransferase
LTGAPADLQSYYAEWWENPADPRHIVFDGLTHLVRDRLPAGTGRPALDLGSGKGTIVSLLVERGFRVTSVEVNGEFVGALRARFPEVRVVEGDATKVLPTERTDLVTAIEFTQNLDRASLMDLLERLAPLTPRLHINISNRNSLHGRWAAWRGFQLPFVYTYTPTELRDWLGRAGFQIVFAAGVGLVTPITLWSRFRGKLIPIWLARLVNSVADRLFPELCHLYYVEALAPERKSG